MTTILNERLDTGDVIELKLRDDVVSTLVLLATDEFVILDPCDDSTPFVVKRDELIEYRKFVPAVCHSSPQSTGRRRRRSDNRDLPP